MSKYISFFRLTTRQKVFFISALICLPICHFAVNSFSLPFVLKILRLAPVSVCRVPRINKLHLDYMAEISRMTKTAANKIPILKVRCLAQALTVFCLAGSLRRYCILNLGACYSKTTENLSAHAWVSYGGIIILGYEERNKYYRVASFN